MSFEPIEKPSKCSRNSSARIALDGSSHIMITCRPFSPRRRPCSPSSSITPSRLGERAHERDHDLDVGQAHLVAHVLQRLALHREAVGEVRRTGSARRRGSRSSGSPRAARSGSPPIRLAYSLDLKSDMRTITGCGANAAAMVATPSATRCDEELARASGTPRSRH